MSDWEKLYAEAVQVVAVAYAEITNITGWSGSGGNWPLQDASVRIKLAYDSLNSLNHIEDLSIKNTELADEVSFLQKENRELKSQVNFLDIALNDELWRNNNR